METTTQTTATKPAIKATKQTLGKTVIIQFEIGSVTAGSALESAALAAGYSLDGQNGDLRWYKSPLCKTAQDIDNARNPIKQFFA